jgi:hypothetical protein
MAKGIRLTEDDYIRFYPLWKPIEIQNEFHPYSQTKTLQDLIRKHGKGDTKTLQRAFKSVRTSITPKG